MKRLFLIGLSASLLLLTPFIIARAGGLGEATSRSTTSPTTATTQTKIPAAEQALIDQLNADDWHTRQSAEDGLVAMGQRIRPEINSLQTSGTPEQRARAETILGKLDRAAANSPTLITLHRKDANPQEIFAAIGKQAGTEIGFWPENIWAKGNGMQQIPAISVDLDNQPFWLAIAQVCRDAGARAQVMNMGQGPKLTIQRGNPGEDWFSAPQCADGRFIVMPWQLTRSRVVTFAPRINTSASDQMQFRVLVDPKVSVLSASSSAVLTLAMNDKGNSILPPSAVQYGTFDSPGLCFDVNTPVAYQNDGATKLTHLEGHIDIAVAKRVQTLDVANVVSAVGQLQQLGNWTLTVQACQIESRGGNLSVDVTVPDQSTPPNEVWALMRRIALVDAAGKTINGNGFGGSGNGTHYQANQNFNTQEVIQKPVRLTWSVPTEVEEMKIPFHFTDLPLPAP